MNPDHRIALCPGSYDPVTNGHLDVISRAAELFDEVIVAVVNLPLRKGSTLFDAEERIGFIEEATQHLDVRARRCRSRSSSSTSRGRWARRSIVKGLRAISDFEYEFEMHQLNRLQAADIDTLYLMASPQYSFISSSGIKELATFGGKIDELVPERVAAALEGRAGPLAKQGLPWTSSYSSTSSTTWCTTPSSSR